MLKYWKAERAYILRFIAVGAANTFIGYGTYLVLLELGATYYLAWGIALALSLAIGFCLNGALVFKNLKPSRFVLYVFFWLAVYGMNVAVLGYLGELGVSESYGPALLLPINVVLSYLAQRFIVFR